MKSTTLCLGIIAAALALPTCTTPVTVNNILQSAVPASPSPAVSPLPVNCPTIARIGIIATNGSGSSVTIAHVGETVRLDATPKDSQNSPVPASCHGPTATWSYSGPCTLTGNGSFTPSIRGDALGACLIGAVVGGIPSDSFVLTVIP